MFQPRTAMDVLTWLQTGRTRFLFVIYHVRDGQTVRMQTVGYDPIEEEVKEKA